MPRRTLALLVGGGVVLVILLGWLGSCALRRAAPVLSPAIGLLEVKGAITDPIPVVEQLKKYEKNPVIRGLVLRIDSPGGGAAASQAIYSQIKRFKETGKRVVVSMGAVAASGGYYIALPADRIVAHPGTITGSIGVIMGFPNIEELLRRWGIRFEVVKSRAHKDIGSPFRAMTPEERRILGEVVEDVYQQFVEAVVEGRGIPREEVLRLADGRFVSGRQAYKMGLVDTLGTLEDAIRIAGEMAGIKGEPRVVKARLRVPLWRRILEGIGGWLSSPKLLF